MKTIGKGKKGIEVIGIPTGRSSKNIVITPDVKYESYTAASGDTSISDILPDEGEKDVIYRVGSWDGTEFDATKMSEYAWDGSDYTLLRVVDSIGEVFDISAYNASGGTLATYADLAAALGTSGANVPEGVRKGGMSVKYVQSSDNNYVQYLYKITDAATASKFTNVANWEKVNLEEELNAAVNPIQVVSAQAFAQLQAELEGLKVQLQNLGECKAKCVDSEDLPKVCGASLVIEGSGAPSVVPMFVGQRYHDTVGKKVYEAMAVTNSTANWTLLN